MRFETPVRIATEPAGNIALTIRDIETAARFLHDEWPLEKRGASHFAACLAACAAVVAAYDSEYPPELVEAARSAFAAAAEEADMLLPNVAKPERIPSFKSPSWRKRR